MNIKRRLNLGFAFAIFLVIMVGVVSLITLQKQSTQAELVRRTYNVIRELENIESILVSMETGRRGFRATNDKKFLQPYYQGRNNITPAFQKLATLINDPEQEKNRNTLKIKIDDILSYWEGLGTDASGYTPTTLLEVSTVEEAKMNAIRAQIGGMISAENALLVKQEKINGNSVMLAKWEVVVGILLILLIVIALISQILKEFNNRKKAEARLRKSFKELAAVNEENAERNWLLAGVSEVNNSLPGHLNTSDLADGVLNAIVKYLELAAGAFYILNEKENEFQLSSSYALSTNTKHAYQLKEGLIGEAALQNTPTIIKDVPSKYLTIASGTISANPAHACYVPIYLDTGVKGVIELLSFKPFNDKHVNFLKILSNNIAVALHSAQSREKVMQLLDQVQQQKETLENQQEELRQTNEELSLQAEVLQASEEELRVQEEELRQINVELEEKNHAVESARQALALKAKELETTSKFKSEFLANMSHELRTPLNSVLILAKLLSNNPGKNLTEKQVAHAKIIHKSGSDLLRLINDILDLSKIEAGKVELHLEEVPIKNIATDMEQLFTVVAEEKGIEYTVKIEPQAPEFIKTDRQRIEQILKNLLSNAFKFTPTNGTVRLEFSAKTQNSVRYLSISVSDTGIGIRATEQDAIFEAFQQADGSTNRKFGGTGLGLSITKELVKLLEGKIKVESKEGEGSCFTIDIPFDNDASSALDEGEREVQTTPSIPDVKEQTAITDDRYKLQKDDKVMLIIEDDLDFATLMKGFAISKGYKTVIALKGDEGLFCAKKYHPTAIILDMTLPVINGGDLLKIFKKDPSLKDIPVHVISGAEDVKFNTTGALAFLRKPLEKQEIDNAFTLIEEYIHAAVKHVLLLSGENLKDDVLQILTQHKNYDVKCDVVTSVTEAVDKVDEVRYDCIIADMRADVEKGIADLRVIYEKLLPQRIPTIIYLDEDITSNDELRLKTIADVIVRKSALSNNRLMDELELFLYKVQEESRLEFKDTPSAIGDNNLEKKKVLVVDDDMRNLFALTAALEHEQMQIVTASDGKEALEALEKNKGIDIVLMDIMMPEMDGYEAMRAIRTKMKLTKLPIIALTAKAMTGDKEKCINAGASDYITKPVDTQKLVSLMRVWLS